MAISDDVVPSTNNLTHKIFASFIFEMFNYIEVYDFFKYQTKTQYLTFKKLEIKRKVIFLDKNCEQSQKMN